MCGIFVVSDHQAKQKVLQGLKNIEYRGYDSWGVAVFDQGQQGLTEPQLTLTKKVGKISQVIESDIKGSLQSSLAIGHTRWATHGGVTVKNAHPHLSKNGLFAVVHNGVVENYQELKQKLSKKGHKFITQTDTEIIVRSLEQVLEDHQEAELNRELVSKVCLNLEGRSTVVILSSSGQVYAYRNGSPLVIGMRGAAKFISSDVLSLSQEADKFLPLAHGQLVVLTESNFQLFEADSGQVVPLRYKKVSLAATKLDRGGYPHFMLKEIYDQSRVLNQVLNQEVGRLKRLVSWLKKARHIWVIGAGSASYAAGQMVFELRRVGLMATMVPAYEAQVLRQVVGVGDVCVAFSQSGETADTIEVVEWFKEQGVKIVSLVNMPGSSLAQLSDLVFPLQVGPEVGVASTKALTGQMVWGWGVAKLVSGKSWKEIEAVIRGVQSSLRKWLANPQIHRLLRKLAKDLSGSVFILGRGQLFFPALESALKLKEVSYLHVEAFSGGELKHGVIALIEKNTTVICLIKEDQEQSSMLNAVAEVKARGARVVGVSTVNNEFFDTWIKLPQMEELTAVMACVPAQLLTYYRAVADGRDPDKPRNLAKSVTVK